MYDILLCVYYLDRYNQEQSKHNIYMDKKSVCLVMYN